MPTPIVTATMVTQLISLVAASEDLLGTHLFVGAEVGANDRAARPAEVRSYALRIIGVSQNKES